MFYDSFAKLLSEYGMLTYGAASKTNLKAKTDKEKL